GPRRAGCLSVAAPAPLAGAVRPLIDALPQSLSAESREPPPRLSPAAVVRAKPSRRGLCRDVRGVAHAALQLAQALRPLAGAEETSIRRRADDRDRQAQAGGDAPLQGRAAEPAHADAGRTLQEEAGALRAQSSQNLRPRSAPHLL